ncbi:MAG: BtpA/SgcQ family protein [Anaerolineaceae bacterium]|nr:BtpA/SgcQ family protein [Anaerolineaceae bacterium]
MSMYPDDTRFQSFHDLFGVKKPIIGMLHLPPLPGSPIYNGKGLKEVIDRALYDANELQEGGVDALEVENFSDPTYYPQEVGPELTAAMAVISDHVIRAASKPVGICILADPKASLSVAHAVGAKFVRATFFTEASVDVSGLVCPKPHELLRFRKFLDPSIKIFTDVHIKHSAPLVNRPLGDSALDAKYFLSDAVIISGTHTGKETKLEDLKEAKDAVEDFPVLVGSGFRKEHAAKILAIADGAIVGTSLKKDGVSSNVVDRNRVRELMEVVKEIRSRC